MKNARTAAISIFVLIIVHLHITYISTTHCTVSFAGSIGNGAGAMSRFDQGYRCVRIVAVVDYGKVPAKQPLKGGSIKM